MAIGIYYYLKAVSPSMFVGSAGARKCHAWILLAGAADGMAGREDGTKCSPSVPCSPAVLLQLALPGELNRTKWSLLLMVEKWILEKRLRDGAYWWQFDIAKFPQGNSICKVIDEYVSRCYLNWEKTGPRSLLGLIFCHEGPV